jgi:murein DD-endopeptidase MepM/ murein hydrolase activator NlpD
MRLRSTVFALVLLLLAGCQPEGESPTGGGGAQEAQAILSTTPAASPSSSVAPVHKGSTILLPNVQQGRSTQPAKIPRSSPLPLTATPRPAFTICSPLVDTPLDELRLIVSDPYRPPPPGSDARHQGVDFAYFHKYNRAAIEGAGIESVLKGQVAAAVVDSFPFGNMLMIETPGALLPAELANQIQIASGESLYLLYAHMERPPALILGDGVDACHPLGLVGKTGNSGGAHLHLEARLGPAGARFTGMAYYKAWATDEERANYLLWSTSGTFRHFDPMTLLAKTPK